METSEDCLCDQEENGYFCNERWAYTLPKPLKSLVLIHVKKYIDIHNDYQFAYRYGRSTFDHII